MDWSGLLVLLMVGFAIGTLWVLWLKANEHHRNPEVTFSEIRRYHERQRAQEENLLAMQEREAALNERADEYDHIIASVEAYHRVEEGKPHD